MGSNIWFTSDTHFGHGNIIKYCNRPFLHKAGPVAGTPDVYAQDDCMIRRINEVVKPGDSLYHLGDVAYSSFDVLNDFLRRLNTQEVHLILGNHDKEQKFKTLPFRSISEVRSMTIGDQQVILCHYPMRAWRNKGRGSFQLYGHMHGIMAGRGRQMDVGVDTNDFYPYSWTEINNRLKHISFTPDEKDD